MGKPTSSGAPALPTWLFVAYGGGHIAMVLPVARRVRELGLARPLVLALTTAQEPSRAAGLDTVGFADFADPADGADAAALAYGAQLAAHLPGAAANLRESAAYLGLNYADLVAQGGPDAAQQAYREFGRQCFRPMPTLRRILKRVRPALVVATNSPRAEQAAVEAARELGIPAVCLVDLFAVDEKRWIGRPGYADRVCVLNEAVRQSLIDQGRRPDEVVVTGNPAFDGLLDAAHRLAGAEVRRALVPDGRKLVLYAPSPEPARHPGRAQDGNPRFPHQVLQALLDWAAQRPRVRLALRPHPSQRSEFTLAESEHAVMAGQEWPLEPLLHASDAVCITVSTVGLQSWLIGKPVVQVHGSMFDDGAPFSRMGLALGTALPDVAAALDTALDQAAQVGRPIEPAMPRVIEVLRQTAHL
ncbi:MAG: UDP-glycosyltransferase [Gemmatimonadetes bacterium]|nr:UDP-glycosyltransferase [Gemmatimonadota bacterium]